MNAFVFAPVVRDPVRAYQTKFGQHAVADELAKMRAQVRAQFPDAPEPTDSELMQQLLDAYVAKNGRLPAPKLEVDPAVEVTLDLKESTQAHLEKALTEFRELNGKTTTKDAFMNAVFATVKAELMVEKAPKSKRPTKA